MSAHWADGNGCVHWVLPNSEVRYAPPKNFGVIGNGHHIKLAPKQEEGSPWDTSYEAEFQGADSCFPSLITWLETLERGNIDIDEPLASRFHPVEASDEEIVRLVTCIVSLAIRSPMNREAAVSLAESLRGGISERERNCLIGMNIRHDQRQVVGSLGTRGKFVAVFSLEREFVFGDGFFHNLRSPAGTAQLARMFVPVTPNIGVLFAQPTRYRTQPRLCTLRIRADEADELNQAIQLYSGNAVFYRNDQPTILDVYRCGRHLVYENSDNPVDRLILNIPGVPPRDTSLDFLS